MHERKEMNRNIRKTICSLTAMALLQLPVCAEVVKIPVGTAILLKTVTEVTSNNSVGDVVALTVVQDVVVEGKVVVKAGATAIGEVSGLVKKSFFGIPTKIAVTVKRITMVDSNVVAVGNTKTVEGDDRMMCSVIGAILCLFPALIQGGDAKVASGSTLDAIVTSPAEVTVP
jgi:hypothetical protein